MQLQWSLSDFETAVTMAERQVNLEVMGMVRGLQAKFQELLPEIFYNLLIKQMETEPVEMEDGHLVPIDRMERLRKEFDILITHGGNFYVFRLTTHPIETHGRVDDIGMIWLYGASGHDFGPKSKTTLKFWWAEEGRWVYHHDVSHPGQKPRQAKAMIALAEAVRGVVAILGG